MKFIVTHLTSIPFLIFIASCCIVGVAVALSSAIETHTEILEWNFDGGEPSKTVEPTFDAITF